MFDIHIENAHATPPHLDVILHLGSSGGVHGSFAVICVWVAQFVFVYSILGDVGDILDAWGVSGHLFGPFRMSWASLGGLGAALGSHLQSEEKKLQKMSERRDQYRRLGGAWCPPWVHRVSLLRPRTAKKQPCVPKRRVLGHLENSDIPMRF